MAYDYKVGQNWLFVPNHRGLRPEWVTISKVGRKWATFDRDRVAIGSAHVDGGEYISPGTLYPSLDSYNEQRRNTATKQAFLEAMRRHDALRTATAQQVVDAAAILGLTLDVKL